MIHTNPDFIYELKIGIAALQRACYEVIEACVKIDYAVRLLDKNPGEASSGKQDGDVQQPATTGMFTQEEADRLKIEAAKLNKEVRELFTPSVKPKDAKGDPLAELAAQLSPADREKLISSLEKK